jgi:hypothetical protein
MPRADKRCARVLAGRLVATYLPARTRVHRWLHLILKDHTAYVYDSNPFSRLRNAAAVWLQSEPDDERPQRTQYETG